MSAMFCLCTSSAVSHKRVLFCPRGHWAAPCCVTNKRCNTHRVRVNDATDVWNAVADFSGRVVRCPFGCVVVDETRERHLNVCAAAEAARAKINEDRVAVVVDGSCVVCIGSKQHGVSLEIVFVHGIVGRINAVCAFGGAEVPCVLHIVDACLNESIDLVITKEGPVSFTATRTSAIAAHSAVRWLSATWP